MQPKSMEKSVKLEFLIFAPTVGFISQNLHKCMSFWLEGGC